MAGAAICFYIARILGRDVAEKLTSRSGLAQIDTFFENNGKRNDPDLPSAAFCIF